MREVEVDVSTIPKKKKWMQVLNYENYGSGLYFLGKLKYQFRKQGWPSIEKGMVNW